MLKFVKVREEHLSQILTWRTSAHVTKFMHTDIEHDLEKQQAWFREISNNDLYRYWMIEYGNKFVGVLNINNIDLNNKHCTWGYYIGETSCTIGGFIHPYLNNYVFFEMNLNKIYGDVLEGNEAIMRFHEIYGYRRVGIHKQHIYKYGKYHDVILVELLADTWRNKYHKKYEDCVSLFEV